MVIDRPRVDRAHLEIGATGRPEANPRASRDGGHAVHPRSGPGRSEQARDLGWEECMVVVFRDTTISLETRARRFLASRFGRGSLPLLGLSALVTRRDRAESRCAAAAATKRRCRCGRPPPASCLARRVERRQDEPGLGLAHEWARSPGGRFSTAARIAQAPGTQGTRDGVCGVERLAARKSEPRRGRALQRSAGRRSRRPLVSDEMDQLRAGGGRCRSGSAHRRRSRASSRVGADDDEGGIPWRVRPWRCWHRAQPNVNNVGRARPCTRVAHTASLKNVLASSGGRWWSRRHQA